LSDDFLSNPPDAGTRFSERRSNPRYALIAAVQITDPIGKIQLSGRTSEVSVGGCYVDVLNTLPSGTVIQIRIQRDKGTFESWGRIRYVHQSIGMGVMFFSNHAGTKRSSAGMDCRIKFVGDACMMLFFSSCGIGGQLAVCGSAGD